MKARTRIRNKRKNDENQSKVLTVIGAASFQSFREKQNLINQIKKEFQNKVQIRVQDNMLHYTYYYKENQNVVMI